MEDTPLIGLTRPNQGDFVDTWGDMVNANMAKIDRAMQGLTKLAANATHVLTAEQARCRQIIVTGSGSTTITFPAREGFYTVRNDSGGDLTLNSGAGASVVLPGLARAIVHTDGADTYMFDLTRTWRAGGAVTPTGTSQQISMLRQSWFRECLIKFDSVTVGSVSTFRLGLPDPTTPAYVAISAASLATVSGSVHFILAADGKGVATARVKSGAATSNIEKADTVTSFDIKFDPAAPNFSAYFDWGGTNTFTGGTFTVHSR